jgi:MFS family permease
MLLVGVAWFALASLLCGLAPNLLVLVLARALQGVGGALLTPGSLAILQASFREQDRARASGRGPASAASPVPSVRSPAGWLVETVGWRWVFFLNLPLAAVVILVALRHVPESSDPEMARGLDVPGAVLAALGLAGLTYGLIAWPDRGFGSPVVWGSLLAGVVGLVAFVVVESRSASPMLPLEVFRNRLFTATNVVTFAVYAALSGVFFVLVVELRWWPGSRRSPRAPPAARDDHHALPLGTRRRAGQRIGPRIPDDRRADRRRPRRPVPGADRSRRVLPRRRAARDDRARASGCR